MAWLTFEVMVWAFVGICLFGAAINAVDLVLPEIRAKPLWRRLRPLLDLGAEGVFIVWIALSLYRWTGDALFHRDGAINVMALGIYLAAVAGVAIFAAMARASLTRRSVREERETEERAEALAADARRELTSTGKLADE